MADKENVDLIRKMYDAFSAGDVKAILGSVNPDAEWINYGPSTVPYMGNFNGRVPSFFQAIAETTTNGKVTADKYVAQGDVVVTQGRYTATVRGTGANIDSPIGHIFTICNGRVASWIGFSDSAAIAAAHTGVASSAKG
jgi:ketosteroid isomerase-like protein